MTRHNDRSGHYLDQDLSWADDVRVYLVVTTAGRLTWSHRVHAYNAAQAAEQAARDLYVRFGPAFEVDAQEAHEVPG